MNVTCDAQLLRSPLTPVHQKDTTPVYVFRI